MRVILRTHHTFISIFFLMTLCCMYAGSAYGQFTTGQAEFDATPDDSLGMIKQQLIYLATRNIISQELSTIGLDEKLFWQRYKEALQQTLTPLRKKLSKAYHNGKQNQTKKQKQGYRRAWRRQRLKTERTFGRLSQILSSYKVGRVMRSPKNPQTRYLKVEGKVNHSKLKRVYFRFLKAFTSRTIDKVYWTFDLSLFRGGRRQLGFEGVEALERILNASFLKRLQQELGHTASNIIITNLSDMGRIQAHLKLSEGQLNQLRDRVSGLGKRGDTLVDSVWIHAIVEIGLSSEVSELERVVMESRGDFIVTELGYNRPIYLSQIKAKKELISKVDPSLLSSEVGNRVFHRVIPEFIPMKATLAKLSKDVVRIPIRIVGFENYVELKAIRDILARAGGRYRLRTYLDYFSLDEAQVIVEYIGKKNHMKRILAMVRGQRLENSKTILMNGEIDPLELKLSSPPEV